MSSTGRVSVLRVRVPESPAALHVTIAVTRDSDQTCEQGDLTEIGTEPGEEPVPGAGHVVRPRVVQEEVGERVQHLRARPPAPGSHAARSRPPARQPYVRTSSPPRPQSACPYRCARARSSRPRA